MHDKLWMQTGHKWCGDYTSVPCARCSWVILKKCKQQGKYCVVTKIKIMSIKDKVDNMLSKSDSSLRDEEQTLCCTKRCG